MALDETLTETAICNMSLAKLGANKTLVNVETDTSFEAQQCRVHYEPTRDALVRSHLWRFARARSVLTQGVDPEDFEWDNQFALPDDFLRFRSIDEETGITSRDNRHAIEGQRILTNFSSVSLLYIKKVTDVTAFDSLFVEVFVLQLALKLTSIAGATPKIRESLKDDLELLMPSVRAIDADETNVGGRSDWNLARHGGIGITGPERFL